MTGGRSLAVGVAPSVLVIVGLIAFGKIAWWWLLVLAVGYPVGVAGGYVWSWWYDRKTVV